MRIMPGILCFTGRTAGPEAAGCRPAGRRMGGYRAWLAAALLISVSACRDDVIVVESVSHAGWVSDTDMRMMLAHTPLQVVVRGTLPGFNALATEAAVIDGVGRALNRPADSVVVLANQGSAPHILVRFDPPLANTADVCVADAVEPADMMPASTHDGGATVMRWRISICNGRNMAATATATAPIDLQVASPLEDLTVQCLVLMRNPRENERRRGN